MIRIASLAILVPLLVMHVAAFGDTRFSTGNFAVTLPGNWHDVSEPDVVAYECDKDSQQLVAGRYLVKQTLTESELHKLLKEFVEIRRQTEEQMFRGRAVVGNAFYRSMGPYIRAEYWGESTASMHRFVTVVFGSKFSLQSFRYESQVLTHEEFRAAAEAVLNGIKPPPSGE